MKPIAYRMVASPQYLLTVEYSFPGRAEIHYRPLVANIGTNRNAWPRAVTNCMVFCPLNRNLFHGVCLTVGAYTCRLLSYVVIVIMSNLVPSFKRMMQMYSLFPFFMHNFIANFIQSGGQIKGTSNLCHNCI